MDRWQRLQHAKFGRGRLVKRQSEASLPPADRIARWASATDEQPMEKIMTIITETTVPSSIVDLFKANGDLLKTVAVSPSGIKPVAVDPSALAAEFKARPGTHRMALLLMLAAQFGQQRPRAELIATLYGTDQTASGYPADPVGALGMCIEGARKSIKKLGLPYVIVKENATVGIHPVLKPFAFN